MEEIILRAVCDLYSNGDLDQIVDTKAAYNQKDNLLAAYETEKKELGEKIALENAIFSALAFADSRGFENGLKIGTRLIIRDDIKGAGDYEFI